MIVATAHHVLPFFRNPEVFRGDVISGILFLLGHKPGASTFTVAVFNMTGLALLVYTQAAYA